MSDELQKLYEIKLSIENLKLQLGHLGAIVESEQGTLQREADRLRKEISLVEEKINDYLFRPETGMLIQLDRLIQESKSRKRMQAQIIALAVAVIGLGATIVKILSGR